MTKLAKVDDGPSLGEVFQLAKVLQKAGGFLPAHLKNEGEITAVVLAGRELGIGPMASIRGIRLIHGNVTLDAALQLGCMQRAGGTVEWQKDGSDGEAVGVFMRPGHPPFTSRFTIKMAQDAGLMSNGTWKKYPSAMLRARCVTIAGKACFPDVLAGVYLPDELPAPEAPRPAAKPRTLDDVANDDAAQRAYAAQHQPGKDAVERAADVAGIITGEPLIHDPETGEIVDARVEPVAPDDGECPVFAGGKHAGQSYREVPAGYLRWCLQQSRFCEDERNVAWAKYLVDLHEWEKGSSDG